MKTVGFLGLGIMGRPMVQHLLRAGYRVLVYDVVREAIERVVSDGATAATPAELAKAAEFVFLCLPNGEIVKDALFGEQGLSRYLQPGSVVVDTSSITPVEANECSTELQKIGVEHLDAPISGGEPGAIAGTLAFMVGGKQEIFDRAQEYFQAMGSSAVLVGASGSGCITKLANQVIVNLNIAAVSEALVLACKCGADPQKVYQAIRGGLAGSVVLDAKAPMMFSRNFKPGGTIKINAKDIKNVLETSHIVHVSMPLTAQVYEIQQALIAQGHIMDDHAGYVQYFEQLANVRVETTQS